MYGVFMADGDKSGQNPHLVDTTTNWQNHGVVDVTTAAAPPSTPGHGLPKSQEGVDAAYANEEYIKYLAANLKAAGMSHAHDAQQPTSSSHGPANKGAATDLPPH
jgi:hypothetical protein